MPIQLIILILSFITSTIYTQTSDTEYHKRIRNNPKDKEAYIELIKSATTRDSISKIGNDAIQALGPQSSIYTELGNSYMKAQDFNNAVNSYRQAVSLNPRSATSYSKLGLGLLRIGLFRQAEVAFKAAISLTQSKAGQTAYWTYLAITFENLQLYSEAQQSVDTALKINPTYPQALEVSSRLKTRT